MPDGRKYRFSLWHLMVFVTIAGILAAIVSRHGYFARDGVWEVQRYEFSEAWWHGIDPDTGQETGGVQLVYYAVCRDGDQEKRFQLAILNGFVDETELEQTLELSVGDQFRVVPPGRPEWASAREIGEGVRIQVIADDAPT